MQVIGWGAPARPLEDSAPSAGTLWAPGELANLGSWYDPSDADTVTLSSGAVSALANKQGLSTRNLGNSTSSQRPALSAAAINGRDALSYDGGDVLYHTSPFMYAAGSAAVAMVLRGLPQSDKHIMGEGRWGDSPIYSLLRTQLTNVNGAPDSYIQVHGANPRYPGYTDGTEPMLENPLVTHVVVSVDTGTNISHWVDGVLSSSKAYTRQSMSVNRFYLGALMFLSNVSGFYSGLIGEVIQVSGVPTTDDRQRMEGYLAHRWGSIDELDAGHPYKSAAPMAA